MKKFVLTMAYAAVLTILFITGCKTVQVQTGPVVNYVNVSDSLIQAHLLTPDKLALIDYVNGPSAVRIDLKRRWYEKYDSIFNGELNLRNVERRDSVIINPGTPGRLIEYDSVTKFIKIGFEESDTLYLLFGPDKDKKGTYILLSEEGTKPPKTQYGSGVYYTITSGANGTAQLFMVVNSEKLLDPKGRVAPGQRHDNSRRQSSQQTTGQPPVNTNQQSGVGGPNDY